MTAHLEATSALAAGVGTTLVTVVLGVMYFDGPGGLMPLYR